jgi:hypothetical protein
MLFGGGKEEMETCGKLSKLAGMKIFLVAK